MKIGSTNSIPEGKNKIKVARSKAKEELISKPKTNLWIPNSDATLISLIFLNSDIMQNFYT